MLMNCVSGMDIKTDNVLILQSTYLYLLIDFNSYITANEP